MQKFERLVQEDLSVGIANVWVAAPGRGKLYSTQVGLHTVARGRRSYEASWTPGAIAAGGNASTTVTVPDATTGDTVLASHDKMLTNDLRILGHVSADDTAKVVMHNPTAATITVPAGTVRVIVFPFLGVAAEEEGLAGEIDIEVGDGEMTFTPLITGGSGINSYAWSAWSEYGGSEGSPAATSTDEIWELPIFGSPIVSGQVKLVVTDTITLEVLTLGPEAWTYP